MVAMLDVSGNFLFDKAGGYLLFRKNTRLTFNRRTESARLYEHLP